MSAVLLYTGSIMILAWGVAHLMPTSGVVRGFGPLSEDNRRIITMEWIAEGMTLCFIGLLVLIPVVTAGADTRIVVFAARSCAAMLLVLAALSSFTGARTSILPMRLCPVVKTFVAALFLAGTV